MTSGSGTNLFIHIVAYGHGDIFVNFIIKSTLRKMTITSTFHIYNIIMYKAKWDRQIKVHIHFSKNIVCNIFSKKVLKVKILKNTKSAVCC